MRLKRQEEWGVIKRQVLHPSPSMLYDSLEVRGRCRGKLAGNCIGIKNYGNGVMGY